MVISKLLVLAVTKRRQASYGYEIYQDLRDWRAETWTDVRPGSIYHAIMALEKDGHLKSIKKEIGKRGSARTLYQLTALGERTLAQWLEEALASLEPNTYAAGLAFRGLVVPERLQEIANERTRKLEEALAFMHTLPRSADSPIPAGDELLIQYWTDFIEFQTRNAKSFAKTIEGGRQ